ncbi:MAG: ATP-binding cassette domain-containing protein, partial [Chryseobacterium sp.]
MIKVESVSKSFDGKPAVDDISFQANEKEILVLLGTSGCGKTTTLKMINRLIEADSGTILIDGKNIGDQKVEDLRMGIGFVMQNSGLFPHYTIRENIATVPNLLKWDK